MTGNLKKRLSKPQKTTEVISVLTTKKLSSLWNDCIEIVRLQGFYQFITWHLGTQQKYIGNWRMQMTNKANHIEA